MADILLEGIGKCFGAVRALEPLTLEARDGEFVALLGPSGCGKTTTLNIVAGLEQPSEGTLLVGGEDITRTPPMDRDIAMVFQSYALYPHMTVAQNLSFALEVRGRSKAEIAARVARAAETLDLAPYLDRYPRALSGGQRQRVALGRALVREPKAFLLDEPLSNLDAVLRLQMRAEIAGLFRSLATTALYVTHDQAEAMTMADRIAVFRSGCLQQFATPLEIYRAPSNAFVASFVGAPPMSFVNAVMGEGHVRLGELLLPSEAPVAPGRRLRLGLRPEDLHIESGGAGFEIAQIEHLGGYQIVLLRAGTVRLSMIAPSALRLARGGTAPISIKPRNLYLFDHDSGETLSAPGLLPS